MAEGDGSRETMVNVIDIYLSTTTTVRTLPHAPDLPPLAVGPSSSAVRPRHDGPAGWKFETILRSLAVLAMRKKKNGGGSDLKVNGSDGLRAEVCVMRLFLS